MAQRKRSAAEPKPKRYIMVHGKSHSIGTALGVRLARLALFDAGYTETRIYQNGQVTREMFYATLGKFSDAQR